MKNRYPFLILLFLISFAVGFSRGRAPDPAPSPTPNPSLSATPSPTPTPPPPSALRVEFMPVEGYATKAEAAKIKRVGEAINKLKASPCFKEWFANRKLNDTDGNSPLAVGEHLAGLSGKVPVKMYYRCWPKTVFKPWCTSAVAYREGDMIYLNRAAFWPEQPDSQWAKTQGHEGLGHLLGGYGHPFNWTATRDYSVPYSLGGSVKANGGDVVDACGKSVGL